MNQQRKEKKKVEMMINNLIKIILLFIFGLNLNWDYNIYFLSNIF